jgi:hypothetical protein
MCVGACVRALMRTSKHVERVVLFRVPNDGSEGVGGGSGTAALGGEVKGAAK